MSREPEPIQQVERTFVRFHGRKLSYYSGCDYFRLASHPALLRALSTGAKKFGLNVAASRLTTGNHPLYGQLERALAKFFGAESATLVSTGYLTNLVVAQVLAGSFSHVLLDERAHPALRDAAALLDCPVVLFQHRDLDQLGAAVKRCGPETRVILLTDGMFAHDGSVAPLKDYLAVLPPDATILVDDAHGAGVLGNHGRGTIEFAGLDRNRIIQTLTLSKAFGVYGGAILGPATLRRRVLERSRLFIGSTPLPLPLANAALQALALLKRNEFRKRLASKSDSVKSRLRAAGCAVPDFPGPIISLMPNTPAKVASLKRALLEAAIYPPLIQYPGGPASGYFRFVISSEHTAAQLDALARAVTTWPGVSSCSFEVRSGN